MRINVAFVEGRLTAAELKDSPSADSNASPKSARKVTTYHKNWVDVYHVVSSALRVSSSLKERGNAYNPNPLHRAALMAGNTSQI